MRHTVFISSVALVAVTLVSGCRTGQQAAQSGTGHTSTNRGTSTDRVANLTLPSGTSVEVTLGTPLSSETANVGDAWSGSIRDASVVNGRNIIAAGSSVSGTVTSVRPARKGDRAMLDLGLTSVTVGDRTYGVHGSMESVIAGSPRARNLGAIGAATVAGGVIGHAVGGSGKGTILGGLIGGGVAAGVVSRTKGWQVVLKTGTPLTFTTNESLAVRL